MPATARPTSSTSPGGRVAERQVLGQPPAHRLGRRGEPSARALRTTWRTRSGRARALASRLDWASAVTARSVPGEITDAIVAHQHLGRRRHRPGHVEHLDRAALDRLHDVSSRRLPSGPAASSAVRRQLVVSRTRQAASSRQVRTGAAAVRRKPTATGADSTSIRNGAVAGHGHRELAGRSCVTTPRRGRGGRPRQAAGASGPRPRAAPARLPRRRPPARRRSGSSGGDGTAVRPGGGSRRGRPRRSRRRRPAGPTRPVTRARRPGPERAPHLGGVGAVDLDGVVRGGGPLVAADRPGLVAWRCRCRPAAACRRRAATQPSVSACACAGRSSGHGAPDVGEQVPVAGRRRGSARSRPGVSSGPGRGRLRGPQRGDQRAGHREAVVEQRAPRRPGPAPRRASGASGRWPRSAPAAGTRPAAVSRSATSMRSASTWQW